MVFSLCFFLLHRMRYAFPGDHFLYSVPSHFCRIVSPPIPSTGFFIYGNGIYIFHLSLAKMAFPEKEKERKMIKREKREKEKEKREEKERGNGGEKKERGKREKYFSFFLFLLVFPPIFFFPSLFLFFSFSFSPFLYFSLCIFLV